MTTAKYTEMKRGAVKRIENLPKVFSLKSPNQGGKLNIETGEETDKIQCLREKETILNQSESNESEWGWH